MKGDNGFVPDDIAKIGQLPLFEILDDVETFLCSSDSQYLTISGHLEVSICLMIYPSSASNFYNHIILYVGNYGHDSVLLKRPFIFVMWDQPLHSVDRDATINNLAMSNIVRIPQVCPESLLIRNLQYLFVPWPLLTIIQTF